VVTPGWDTIQFDNGSNVYTRYAVRLLALRDTIRSTQAVTSAGYHYGIFGVGTGATVTFADNPFQCSTYVQLAGTATLPTRDSVFTYFDVEGGTCVVSGDTVVVGGDVAFAAGVTVTSNAASYMIFSKQCPTITTNGVTLPTYVILNPCVASSIRKIYWQSFYNRTYRNDAYKNSSWR
jgi:hypothetical protein